mgnify:CR=1 FL=1
MRGRLLSHAPSMLGSLFFLAVGNFYSPNVYEPLFWAGAIYLLCRIINGAPSRTWLWFGGVIGFGIKTSTPWFFGVAIVLAILLTPQRRQFAQKWIWLGGLIALVIALPNITLANRTRLAHLGVVARYRKEQQNVVLSPWEFFSQQITLMNPATFPLWFGGLIWLLISREGRRYRVIAFTYLIAFSRIRRHAREELLPRPGLSDVICRGWRCFREDFRAAHALAQTGDCVSRRRVSGRLRTGRSSHLVTGEIARLCACDSFRGPTNGNVAYCGITPTLCRPIRLGGDGALSCAGLRQLACE